MNMKEIQTIAKNIGIKSLKLKKVDLIHLIQKEEGNFDCFATASSGVCDQQQCLWRKDCLGSKNRKVH